MEDVQIEKKKVEKPVSVKVEPEEPKINLTAFAVIKGFIKRRATFYTLRNLAKYQNKETMTMKEWEKFYNGVINK